MKYLAVAVEDDRIDLVKKNINNLRWTRGVKEVVIDEIDNDTFETVTVLT